MSEEPTDEKKPRLVYLGVLEGSQGARRHYVVDTSHLPDSTAFRLRGMEIKNPMLAKCALEVGRVMGGVSVRKGRS